MVKLIKIGAPLSNYYYPTWQKSPKPMTTALPAPSEEERRLLREYRLVSVPSRRSSCSPATSNASSSTTNPTSLLGDQLLQPPPQIVTAIAAHPGNQFSPNKLNGINNNGTVNGHSKPSPKASPKTPTQTISHHSTNSPANGISHNVNNNNKDTNKTSTNTNGIGGGSHHQKHPKHHPNNGTSHRKLRIASQTHELNPEELKRMLELVSDLSYLKLVSMKSAATTTTNGTSTGDSNDCATLCNGKVINQIYPDKECQNQSENRLEQLADNGSKILEAASKPGGYIGSPLSINNTTQCIPYIFEKVDYIKKISARRKALKKFKKARKKSRAILSLNSTESARL